MNSNGTSTRQMLHGIDPARALGGLLDAIQQRGADGEVLLIRLRDDGGWELKRAAEQPKISVTQRDMDMAARALAIGSDLKREWQLAILFAEHREDTAASCRTTAAPAP